MRFLAKMFSVLLLLIIPAPFIGFTQEQVFRFTWLDKNDKVLAARLAVSVSHLETAGQYQADFRVIWFDAEGKVLTDSGHMPFLYLSKWDIVGIAPDKKYRLLSFEQTRKNDLEFQSAGKLVLELPAGFEGEARFSLGFRYALSKELYESGQSENVVIKGSQSLLLTFQTKPAKDGNGDPGSDNGTVISAGAAINVYLLTVSGNYQKLRSKIMDFEEHLSETTVKRLGYWADLDGLETLVENEKNRLKADSLPADSLSEYRQRYSRLSERIQDIRSASRRLQFTAGEPDPGIAGNGLQRNQDSSRAAIRNHFEPLFRRLSDSLGGLIEDQHSMEDTFTALLGDPSKARLGVPAIDSVVSRHNRIKSSLTALSYSLENNWNNYRLDLDGLEPITEIDELHNLLLKGQIDLQSSIGRIDEKISSLARTENSVSWILSSRWVWIILVTVFILIMGTVIWSSARNRKLLRDRFLTIMQAPPGTQPTVAGMNGFYPDETVVEYYTIDYQKDIPEATVGVIHLHASAIKSIYQIVQGALLEKRGADFGGYLFGNQYRLAGKGSSKNELFVDKVCESRMLRPGIANDAEVRADLIDELDHLVDLNKKYRLLGWFTASTDSNMEIREGLMKIHRSFFKEKWQVGMLFNPGSEDLLGAGFLRRKTGYLDPIPDPAAFLSLEELYRFAVNPSPAVKGENADATDPAREYSRLLLNNTWGDSIVESVHFDVNVVQEIITAASHQAIPRDSYQVVGYMYGRVVPLPSPDGRQTDYEVYIERFIEITNELAPRELPGLMLLGWWGQSRVDVISYLQSAIDFHGKTFREPFQVCCLANQITGELRVFTRKHSLEMNNSTIETEEYTVSGLLSR